MASATAAARRHDWPGPEAKTPAAASAARSAADCARCRPITAAPTATAPDRSPASTAISATATTVAEPRSSRTRLVGSHRLGPHCDAGEHRCRDTDPCDDPATVAPHLDRGTLGSGAPGGVDGATVVAAGREAGGFPGRVDTAHLHRDRGKPTDTQDRDGDERGNRERGLDRDTARVITWW